VKLLTWLDVRRVIREKTFYGTRLPDGVVRIGCFSDALEFGLIRDEDRQNAEHALKNWFGDWYQENQFLIQLDIGNAVLPVEFLFGEEKTAEDIFIRPFWEEIAYLTSNDEEIEPAGNIKLPEPYPQNAPRVIAFYSFKGGVGRTLQLSAYLFALLERAKSLDIGKTVLVIDADLEAPGLTYWNHLEKQQPAVSFIDFLEICHYPPLDSEETLSWFAKEVKKAPKFDGKSRWYVVPACLDDRELTDTPVLPEHLSRTARDPWEYGNALCRLGMALGADYVFIDLRSGLSEISAPVIFDPRIQRFIVTTLVEQSVKGTNLVLKYLGLTAPPEKAADAETAYDPSVIMTMLKPEFKALPAFENALTGFRSAYIESEDDNVYSKRLNILETDFSEELLYIKGWEDARLKLGVTSVMKAAREWAENELRPGIRYNISARSSHALERLDDVYKLKEICRQYEYAEEGEGEHLLVTEPLRNLAVTFRDQMPRAVSIGAKGSGKTFNYIQLSRFRYWEKFLSYVSPDYPEKLRPGTCIFPLLQSGKLKDKAKKVLNEARDGIKSLFGTDMPDFSPSELSDRIRVALKHSDWNEADWTGFWINEIAKSLGIKTESRETVSFGLIHRELKNRSLRMVCLFDGLEDIFLEAAYNHVQQSAIRSLIDLPNRLSEIRDACLGIIIFLRRDFLRYAVTQNLHQFENLYRSYDLSWDEDSFFRLVFWICSQAEIIGPDSAEVYGKTREELAEYLEQLWGRKLGADTSKEAYTRNWVFAALTDFKGRLQARDVVRFLYHAGDITVENAKELQFEKWCADRLVPPQAIRRAIVPCSQKKVEEAKEEYPEFEKWVDETLPKISSDKRRIPFTPDEFDIDPPVIRMLEEMGVIYEDKGKDGSSRFYMPEIFRAGLNFSLDKGARPRVLALKRRALGSGVL